MFSTLKSRPYVPLLLLLIFIFSIITIPAPGQESERRFRWASVPRSFTNQIPFPVSIEGIDNPQGAFATESLSLKLRAWAFDASPTLLITEVGLAAPAFVEITNVGDVPINIGGWLLYLYDPSHQSKPVLEYHFRGDYIVPTAGVITLTLNEGNDDTYPNPQSRSNLQWTRTESAAVLLIAPDGRPMDFVATRMLLSSIREPFQIGPEMWTGPALRLGGRFRRVGAYNHRSQSDWKIDDGGSIAKLNPGLLIPFAAHRRILPTIPDEITFQGNQWAGTLAIVSSNSHVVLEVDDNQGTSATSSTLANLGALGESHHDSVGRETMEAVSSSLIPRQGSQIASILGLPVEDLPVVSVEDRLFRESPTGSSSLVIQVSQTPTNAINLQLRITSGSALRNTDFSAPEILDIRIPPNFTRIHFPIEILDDQVAEQTEEFYGQIISIEGGKVGQDLAVFTIEDDDAPRLSVNGVASMLEGPKGDRRIKYAVKLTPASTNTVYVYYFTGAGSALPDSDYERRSGLLEFQPGETNLMVSLDIHGDLTDEFDESFGIILANAVGAEFDTPTFITTIENDDGIPSDSPTITSIDIRGRQVFVEFRSLAGGFYNLQRCRDLSTGAWLRVSEATAVGEMTKIIHLRSPTALTGPEFYRVVRP